MQPRLRRHSAAALAALIFAAPALAFAGEQVTIAGPNGGRAICGEPVAGPLEKRVVCYFDHYLNSSSTPQIFPFPIRFEYSPALLMDIEPGSRVDAISLSLPAHMDAPATGWTVLEGF